MIYWIISLNVRGRGAICINLGMICYDGAAAAHCKGENIAKSISEISPRFLLLCSKVYQMIQILFCGFLSQLVLGQTKSAWGGGGCQTVVPYCFTSLYILLAISTLIFSLHNCWNIALQSMIRPEWCYLIYWDIFLVQTLSDLSVWNMLRSLIRIINH